jgi:ribosomal protein L37AE/L43A
MLTPQRQDYHRSRAKTEEVAQRFTVLESLGDWRRGPCPKCHEEDAFCIYLHGAWACDACGRGGEDAAALERAMGGNIYSRHTGREFGENKPELPIKTVEEILSEAGEGPDWIIEGQAARGAVTECSGLAKKGGKTT